MLKKIIIAVLMFASTLAHSQIVTNVDALRIREIQENLANEKVLTIDSTGLVAWKNQDEITPDLSAYYTKSEIDALLENISYNDLLNAPTNLSDFNNDEGFITISDVPSYTGGDGIDITNNEIRIKQSVLDEINANTNKTLSDVTSKGNVTNTKIKGSEVFSNTMKEDYAQIKNVEDSGWGLLPLQSEMKIALTAKDGTTVLSSIDVSWLASGDLAVSIDDTDPENPELVFSQGGVEVARIPASTLLHGVVRGGDLSGYKLQFKDGGNTVLFDIDLEDLFDNYYTITEADGRFALRTRTITGTGGLTGGGNLTANRTLDLTATTKSDIAKGVTAYGWGNYRDWGLGITLTNTDTNYKTDLNEYTDTGFFRFHNSELNRPDNWDYGTLYHARRSEREATQLAIPVQGNIMTVSMSWRGSNSGVWHDWRNVWDDVNLPDPATESWVNSQGFIKSLSNYYTKTESLNQFVGLSGVQDIADTKTFLASPVVPNPTLNAHAVNKGWVEENYKLQLVKIRNTQSIAASSTVFLKLNNIDFTEGDIPITIASNDEEIIVDEEGVYSIDVLAGGVGISGVLKVLINNSQQDMPLSFIGSNSIVGSGNFVYKLEPNDTIKLSVENQDNQSNLFNYTIVLRKLN